MVDIQRFGRSVQECEEQHELCSVSPDVENLLINLRVIDCIKRVIIPAPGYCYFVALSYVWGLGSTAVRSNISDKLPQSIEDSVKVPTLLGYRYL